MMRPKGEYMFTRVLQITILIAVLLLVAACEQAPDHEYLNKEISPCTLAPGMAA